MSNEDEDTICRAIVEKLRLQNGARFDEAAKTAYDEGRVGLATKACSQLSRAHCSFWTMNRGRENKCRCFLTWNKMKWL